MSATLTTGSIWFLDNLARVHVDGEASNGELAIVELSGRQGDLPPLHVHHRDSETFTCLEGRLTLFAAGRDPVELGPGESAHAPRGVPHVYRVDSETARWLVTTVPSGFEELVRELGVPAEADELPPEGRVHDPGAIGAAAARYGIEILGPPGTLPETA